MYIETKGYKKTRLKDNEIQEIHNKMQSLDYGRNYISEELNMDQINNKLAQYKQN